MKKILFISNASTLLLIFSSILLFLLGTVAVLGLKKGVNGGPEIPYPFSLICIILLSLTAIGYYLTFKFLEKSEKLMQKRYRTDNMIDCYKKFTKEIEDLN